MDLTYITTLLVYVGLFIFLVVLSCILYQFQSQTKVHPLGHFNLQQQCQNDMEESRNMKNLKKMKKLRSDRKSLSGSFKPKTTSNIWICDDFMERISTEMDEHRVKDPHPSRPQSTQTSMYYQNEVDRGITEIMTSIKNDLKIEGLFLNGPEATKHLKNAAIEEWTNSFNEGNAK